MHPENVNFMIFEMVFNSEIFRTEENISNFSFLKEYQNRQPTDFSCISIRTAKSMCATLQPVHGGRSHFTVFAP